MTESLSALAPFFSGDTNTDDFCAKMGFTVSRSPLLLSKSLAGPLNLTDGSNSSAHCWVALELQTSCFSFSNEYFSALNRRRGVAHKPDRKTEILINTTQQCPQLLLSSVRLKGPEVKSESAAGGEWGLLGGHVHSFIRDQSWHTCHNNERGLSRP